MQVIFNDYLVEAGARSRCERKRRKRSHLAGATGWDVAPKQAQPRAGDQAIKVYQRHNSGGGYSSKKLGKVPANL